MVSPLDPEYVSLVDSQGDKVSLNPDGSLNSASVDGFKFTYLFSSSNITVPATATDIFALQGSATKLIRITEVRVSGTQTTGGPVTVILMKRTSLNSGGTFTTTIAAPADTNDPASTGLVYQYSVNPAALGSISDAGFIRIAKLLVPGASTTTYAPDQVWNFGQYSKAIVLRGINQELCVNLNSQTVTGGVFVVSLTWTEE